jgi:hypothetical protein
MPDLVHSLHSRDLGHLRIVAELWGHELGAAETQAALQELAAILLDPGRLRETLEVLAPEAREALDALCAAGGRLPWALFSRRFGEFQQAGPGRRDREQVHRKPASPSEALFYRALIGRAFFETPSGAQEFAYVPDDLLPLLPRKENPPGTEPLPRLGRAANPAERARPLPPSDRLLDDATTLLAALRMDAEPPGTVIPVRVVADFLEAAGILRAGKPQPEAVRRFLEMPRSEALDWLAADWQPSATFNELRQMPGLVCEGEWTNQPRAARQFLLDLLEAIPAGNWWSLPALILDVKQNRPDFQRPAGEYDSWFIQRVSDGTYLRGFDRWDEVDGALLRYLVTGPLAWLGRLQLAGPSEGDAVTAFLRPAAGRLPVPAENGRLHVASQGRIAAPRLLPRAVRYQIARFCEWEAEKADEYRYQVTTASLKHAGEQGLKVSQLLSLLAKHAAGEIPPAFVKACKRWELNGTEARVETQTVLRVSRPEVLEELRKSKAGRFLGEPLGPVTAVVKPGAQGKVLAALAEQGLLAEDVHDPQRTGAGRHEAG